MTKMAYMCMVKILKNLIFGASGQISRNFGMHDRGLRPIIICINCGLYISSFRAPRENREHGGGGRESRERVVPPRDDGEPRGPEMMGDRGRGTRFSDSQQLFVGNLPHNVSEKELRQFFGG